MRNNCDEWEYLVGLYGSPVQRKCCGNLDLKVEKTARCGYGETPLNANLTKKDDALAQRSPGTIQSDLFLPYRRCTAAQHIGDSWQFHAIKNISIPGSLELRYQAARVYAIGMGYGALGECSRQIGLSWGKWIRFRTQYSSRRWLVNCCGEVIL
jgi:hypothetical protein